VDPELLDETCGADPSWVCQQVLESTDGNEFLARTADFLLAKPAQILLILLGAWIVNRVLRRAVRRFMHRVGAGDSVIARLSTDEIARQRAVARAETISQVLRSVASATVYSVALLLVLGEVGINLAPLLAGAGIAGVAIGFGAQSLVKDFLSGVFMLVEDQYGVGDVVDLGEATGTVEAVTLRSTRLRDVSGTVWHVPNGTVQRVANKSQQWSRALIDVSVAYGTDVRHASDVIKQTADGLWHDDEWTNCILEEPEVWGVESLGADGVVIRLVVKTQPAEQFKVMRELRVRIKDAFDAEGIEIPFPQRTLWVRGDVPPVPGLTPEGGGDDGDGDGVGGAEGEGEGE
jgi:small conductance mechanosensitive channel